MAKLKAPTKEKPTTAQPTGAQPTGANVVAEPAVAPQAATVHYQVLARRYRSKDFGELIGQEAIARTLQNAIRTGRTAHAYLFCGTRGVGKTSMARIFARALNAVDTLSEQDAVAGAIMRGEDIDVIEIDAASNRGIDNARDLIAGAGLMPARGSFKIYIIDEVHMLTTPAFNALLKTMEEPPSHVKFILCTTEPQSVPATIQSRCQRFEFRSISTTRIAEHLRDVLNREGAEAEDRVVMQIARMANGSMRDGLSLLERLLAAAVPDAHGKQSLTWSLLEDIFGLPDETLVERVIDAIGRSEPATALGAGSELLERGLSIERALDLLAERFRWIMLAKVCGQDTPLLEVATETRQTMGRLSAHFDAASLVHLIALCDAVASKARDASSPRALYDAAIVRMCMSEQFAEAAGLLAGSPPSSSQSGAQTPRAKQALPSQDPPGGKAPARVADPGVITGPRPAATVPTVAPSASSPVIARSVITHAGSAVEPKSVLTPVVVARPLSGSGASTAPPCASNAEGFWEELVGKAASSPRDGAMLANLVCRSWDGRTLTLSVRAGEAGTGFLVGNPELLRTTVQRLAGRSLEVRVEVDPAATARAPVVQRGVIPQELRDHPVVRLAAELFDAAVVDWAPLRRDEPAALIEDGNPEVVTGPVVLADHDELLDHHDAL